MLRPNFLLLGAPKCGTSSLFNWLAAHPGIAGSRRKETFILMDRENPLLGHPNIHDDGLAAFAAEYDAVCRAPVRMEATTHTLFQRTALQAAVQWPDLRVVVILREPAARVLSSFSYTQNNLGRIPARVGFADYLAAVQAGAPLTGMVQHPASAYVLARDPEYSRYATWLAPWIETLGRDRVLPLLFETMRSDPEGTLREVVDWLGLEPLALEPGALSARNRTEAVRSPGLQRAARRLNAALPVPGGLKRGLKAAYMAVQGRAAPAQRAARDRAAFERLREGYRADNARLAALTGLDLGAWSGERAA
ncbi:sulfotransferase family protein [Sagittula salina]|uniref:Sulfotransferase n=1 Tax=Sagittula salina TaxID=2820268 RepID=A0A940MS91_9RHOB|nr:sulfotransferase [Sagittula salina]MBP0484464.1 sulfotransferase [Sagittula salina]